MSTRPTRSRSRASSSASVRPTMPAPRIQTSRGAAMCGILGAGGGGTGRQRSRRRRGGAKRGPPRPPFPPPPPPPPPPRAPPPAPAAMTPAPAPPAPVARLFVYPVKSCAGIELREAVLTDTGLDLDRAWMVVDAQGRFVTQRELPRMALVR